MPETPPTDLMVTAGCALWTVGCMQTPRERLNATICRLICDDKLPEDWEGGRFSRIRPSKASEFVDRMFRDREFLTEENYDAVSKIAMKRKLSEDKARGFHVKSDNREVFLYVDLEVKVFNERAYDSPYRYYPYDHVVYERSQTETERSTSSRMESSWRCAEASCGDIDEEELLRSKVDPEFMRQE